MELNTLGLTAAVTAFLTIWGGHVAVRRIEYVSANLAPAMGGFILGGLALYLSSAFIPKIQLQAVLGILGTTFLWDAFELVRQQKRVARGHAPANPANPRHQAMLAAPNSLATTLDLLDREPVGRQVDAGEAKALVLEKRKG